MRKAAGDALRQAFMSRNDYESLPVGDKIWDRLARPVLLWGTLVIGVLVLVAGSLMIDVVFEITGQEWPSCQKKRIAPLPASALAEPDESRAAYLLTEEEAALYFYMVIFLPTALVFSVALVYLAAGIAVAYTAPRRHFLLKVVENSCCASKRGGVRCLATLNIAFMIVFMLGALFLGSSIVTLETGCSLLLFWCYEVVCWGVVFLLGGTAFFLHRKAAVIMDEGEHYGSRTVGMELLEANALPLSEMERRVNAGFKNWMGSSVLASSDEEDEPDTGLDDFWEEEAAHVHNVQNQGFL